MELVAKMGEFFYKSITYGSFVLPPLCCGWAWWSWIRSEKSSIRPWRRTASELGLALLSAGICLGAFSIAYLYTHPMLGGLGLPDPTIWSMEAGAIVGVVALLLAPLAKSWTRVALILSSISLLFFLFTIAISP